MSVIKDLDIIERYGIVGTFTTAMTMMAAEMYSGTDNDPEVIGHVSAHEMVPRDVAGQLYPYDVVVSMPIFPLSEGEAMEEMSWRQRMNRQVVKVTVVIFRDLEGYDRYLEDEFQYTA